MPASAQQLAANRSNASKSTGPKSSNGKAIVSTNAMKHSVLSDRLIIDGEKPADYSKLLRELGTALNPVGLVEAALVERITISIWRQRRLVRAETAALSLATQPKKIASDVSQELGLYPSRQLTEADLVPFDQEQAAWCEAALEEFRRLVDFDIEELQRDAPNLYRQLKSDADEDGESLEAHVARYEGGLRGYLSDLIRWCRQELETARKRPEVIQLTEQFRARNLVLSAHTLQLFTRYQTMLDNQLYKALRALREAQEWRQKQSPAAEAPGVSEAVTDGC